MAPLVSVVIPTYSRSDLLWKCVESLRSQTIGDVQIIIADNASPTNISQLAAQRLGSQVTAIRFDTNYFYCGAVNRGSRLATGQYLAVINDDCYVEPTWAENAVNAFDQFPEVGSVASLVLRDGTHDVIDSAGDQLNVVGHASNRFWNQPLAGIRLETTPVFSPAGSCAIYRRALFASVGGFDEDFVAYLDDIDLGFRLQLLGKPTMFVPECRAHHVGGGTPKTRRYAATRKSSVVPWVGRL